MPIIDKATTEDAKTEFATSSYGIHQIINESAHVLDKFLFCMDIIFTSQPNLLDSSGVHPSLHLNYHHQITNKKYDTADKGTLNLLEEWFMSLIGREYLVN